MKILITGTSSGIGKGCAEFFLKKGHEVYGFDTQYIPYADGKKFTLAATVIVGKSGKQIPVLHSCTFRAFL